MKSHLTNSRIFLGLLTLAATSLLGWSARLLADPPANSSLRAGRRRLFFFFSQAQPKKKGSDTALKAADALYEGIREEKLDNGLRVYMKPIAGSPVVTTMVAYRVGSADEDLDNTGLSHYLEHLMFKGTDKLMPGAIDRMTQINGGQKQRR